MRTMRFDSPHHRARRALFGLGVVGLGALALADNLHLFGIPLLRTFWPLIFVLWGLGRIVWPRHGGSWLFGLVMIAVGGLMTAHNLGQAILDFHQWWPVLVILAGVSIVLRGMFPKRQRDDLAKGFQHSGVEHGDRVNIDANFCGVQLQNDSHSFKGGRIEVAFGGVDLDLRQAVIDGPEAVIDLQATFAGVQIKVPREWQVVINVRTTMGAIEDKTAPPVVPGPRLVLRGEAMFGGTEVRH